MFTSLSLKKLSEMCGLAEEDLKEKLAYVKEKSVQTVMDGSEVAIMPGRPQLCTDIDFELGADGIIQVTLKKRELQTIQYFTKEIKSLQAIQRKLLLEN